MAIALSILIAMVLLGLALMVLSVPLELIGRDGGKALAVGVCLIMVPATCFAFALGVGAIVLLLSAGVA